MKKHATKCFHSIILSLGVISEELYLHHSQDSVVTITQSNVIAIYGHNTHDLIEREPTMSPCCGFSPSLQSFDRNKTGMTSASPVYKMIPVSPSLLMKS